MDKRIDAAFPKTPEIITSAISEAVARAARKSRAKQRVASLCCAAAALLLIAGGALYAARLSADPVKSGVASADRLGDMSVVYSANDDPYWHISAECAGGVELPLKTARAFDKRACPDCAGGVATEEPEY